MLAELSRLKSTDEASAKTLTTKCEVLTKVIRYLDRQIKAKIIAAHHGAENMNPYGTIKNAEQAIDEGFLLTTPQGGLLFVKGKREVRAAFHTIAEMGYTIPMSANFYAALNMNLESAHKDMHSVVMADHVTQADLKKMMNADEFHYSQSLRRAVVIHYYDKKEKHDAVETKRTLYRTMHHLSGVSESSGWGGLTKLASLVETVEIEKKRIINYIAGKGDEVLAQLGSIFGLTAGGAGGDAAYWIHQLTEIPAATFLIHQEAIEELMQRWDEELSSSECCDSPTLTDISEESESDPPERFQAFDQDWQAIWPKIVTYFEDAAHAEYRPGSAIYFQELFNLTDITFVAAEQDSICYANLKAEKFPEALALLKDWEAFLTTPDVSAATPTTPALLFATQQLDPYDFQCRTTLQTIIAAPISDQYRTKFMTDLSAYFHWSQPEGGATWTIDDFSSIVTTGLRDPKNKDEALKWLQDWAVWAAAAEVLPAYTPSE